MNPDPATIVPPESSGAQESSDDTTALAAVLADWLPHQRWFAGGAEIAQSVRVAALQPIPLSTTELEVDHVLLEVTGNEGSVQRYQLWVGWRDHLPDKLVHAAIGAVGSRTAYDALHDHDVSTAVLRAVAAGGTIGELTARPEPDAEIDVAAPGLVIGAEQSNTSIVYGDSAILKVFRRLEPGPNPDAEVHRALHAARCKHIADPLGEVTGTVAGRPTTMALLTKFFANSADGWSMATASVRDLMAEGDLHADEVGGDLQPEAYRLGEAVAAVHADLATAFGTHTVDQAELNRTISDMATAAEQAAAQVPEIADDLDAILATFAAAASSGAGLTVQRIHGDLHLGQVLRTLTGWVIIDFEGEPAKSLEHRRAMHSPLKDVAGMLRSFDYAAHHLLVGGPPDAQHAYRATEWADRNRRAFTDGYAATAGIDPRHAGALLRAFELDKAVYEAVYEKAHRPTWEAIPLHAIRMLVHPGGRP